MAEQYATHSHPAWRLRSNWIIMADLSEYGMPGLMEQMWAEKVDADEFILCCIPFFTYGLALGDRVKTGLEGASEFVILERITASGHLVYRCWFGDIESPRKHDLRLEAVLTCEREGWSFEWYSDNLLAIDLPSEAEKDRFDRAFRPLYEKEVIFEQGCPTPIPEREDE